MSESTTDDSAFYALRQLTAETRNVELLRNRLVRSKSKRDVLVRHAAAKGAGTRAIAEAANLTQARVRQIVAVNDKGASK